MNDDLIFTEPVPGVVHKGELSAFHLTGCTESSLSKVKNFGSTGHYVVT